MKRKLSLILLVTFLLTACGAKAEPSLPYAVGGREESYAFEAPAPMVDYGAMPTMVAMDVVVAESDVANSKSVANTVERMVIRNADLSVVVKDPEKSMEEIGKMAEAMGGYVISSNLYQSYTPSGNPVPEASVSVRVPAEKLDEALKKIKDSAVEVQNETVSGQDVTSQYVDLESQLKNLEAAEAQLVEIMSKAVTTEDVMNVFNQLTSIRGQIEVIKGQMKYFEESAALSAVTVRLVAEEVIQPIEVGGWQIKGWARDAVQSLLTFLQDFTRFLIGLVISGLPKLLIIAIVFGLPIWLIVRAVRNARKRKAAAQAPKQEN
ncbi:MAG: DUF4349 domain-containing protein [Chloroflexi bacterium]|nr:DUF4349 domain-containing protein [Chloroflexota bacterium]